MLLQPQSWSPEVYTDITRMLSLNSAQSASGREMHLCPMQFDLADRVIRQFTMPGETVFDPFGGLGTVPLRALKLKRRGIAVELSASYFKDAVYYCTAAEKEVDSPNLFDLIEEEPHEPPPYSEVLA
jgi:DNA modification methylase